MRLLSEVKEALEYLGGVREAPPPLLSAWMRGPVWWGTWWAILLMITLIFSGQTSRFIYIDF